MVMLNSRLIASVGITTFILYSKSLNCVHLVFILRCDRYAVMRVKRNIRVKLFSAIAAEAAPTIIAILCP